MNYCHWPFTTMVVLSDLTVVCGCTDPSKKRILGNLKDGTVQDIWNGEPVRRLRDAQESGADHPYCIDCHLGAHPTHPDCGVLQGRPDEGPQILQIEPCVRCNLRCPTDHCDQNNAGGTRDADLMTLDDFKRIIDHAGPNLEVVRMYNYGETFLNRDAYAMIAYLRETYPDVYIDAHTNGMPFNTQKDIEALVDCGLDYLVLSIDGSEQESYEQYRRQGNLEKVLNNVARMTEYRNRRRLDRPYICWRYILFHWNDSDAEMEKALQTARDIGVDQFVWLLNGADPAFGSRRFVPGTPEYETIAPYVWNTGGEGANALIPGLDRSAPGRLLDAAALHCDTTVIRCRSGEETVIRLDAENIGTMTWRPGVTAFQRGTVRAGFQMFAPENPAPVVEGRSDPLPESIQPGGSFSTRIPVRIHAEPGSYRLKLDLVREMRYWFSDHGGECLWIPLEILPDTSHDVTQDLSKGLLGAIRSWFRRKP
ncbi:MAG TPA: radical SAM protein [bacterium]|nr:radical SAM protein [bacterium]